MNKYAQYITDVPNFPKPGVLFKDITTLLEEPGMLEQITREFAISVFNDEYDAILCPDARGFIFGAALAQRTGKPLILARKPGKLPRPGLSCDYALEYGTNTFEISAGSIKPHQRIVIVDDLLATGGSAEALANLVKWSDAEVVKFLFVIELMELNGKAKLTSPHNSLVRYGIGPGERIVADLEGIAEEDQLRYDGTSELVPVTILENEVLCEWHLEDQVDSISIPKNKIKAIVDINGCKREYLE